MAEMAARGMVPPGLYRGMITRSKDFVARDSHDVRALPPGRVHTLDAESPLDRDQRAEWSRGFDGRSKPGVVMKSGAKSGIVCLCRIGEDIESEQPGRGPSDRRAQHHAPVVADQG